MDDARPILTNRQGHPVSENQALRSVGERGPGTLENYSFIEKLTHFDRERIPGRVSKCAGFDLARAKALPPMPGKPLPHRRRDEPTYVGGETESQAAQPARPTAGETAGAK